MNKKLEIRKLFYPFVPKLCIGDKVTLEKQEIKGTITTLFKDSPYAEVTYLRGGTICKGTYAIHKFKLL